METMKASFELDKCGGESGARHNDRSFDTSKAPNIGDNVRAKSKGSHNHIKPHKRF